MAEPTGKLDRWIAIIGLLGMAMLVLAPSLALLGWVLFLISLLLSAHSVVQHFKEVRERKGNPGYKRQMIALVGMTVCGIGFLGFFVLYVWQNSLKPTVAATSAASVSAPAPAIANNPVDESLPGAAFAVVFSMSDMAVKNRQYLFEYSTPEGASVAFYISRSDRFTYLATDRNGESYAIQVPLGKYGIPILRPVQVYCDVGSGSNYSFLRVFVNGRLIQRIDLSFPIDMGSRQWTDGTLGANLGKSNRASFNIVEFLLFNVTLNEHDLTTLTQNEMAAFHITDNPTNLPSSPPVIPVPQSPQ